MSYFGVAGLPLGYEHFYVVGASVSFDLEILLIFVGFGV
jgi:hypothetical protein